MIPKDLSCLSVIAKHSVPGSFPLNLSTPQSRLEAKIPKFLKLLLLPWNVHPLSYLKSDSPHQNVNLTQYHVVMIICMFLLFKGIKMLFVREIHVILLGNEYNCMIWSNCAPQEFFFYIRIQKIKNFKQKIFFLPKFVQSPIAWGRGVWLCYWNYKAVHDDEIN